MNITKKELKELTDSGSWERGVSYYEEGNVISLFEDKGKITAKVQGTDVYIVQLYMEDGELIGQCTCPMGEAEVFCKHCVAAGLAYLEGLPDTVDGGNSKKKTKKHAPAITSDDIRNFLSQQKNDALVDIIMEQAIKDENLLDRLMMKTARFGQKELDIAAFKHAITRATNTRGYVDYNSAWDFVHGTENVIGSIKELFAEGYHKEVIELAEYALKRAEKALGEMDDSDGFMGDIFEELQEIHHNACIKAKPEPKALAKRLFDWEMATDWDTFHNAAQIYADVLGKEGLAEYRKLAEALWAKVPQLMPNQKKELSYDDKRYRITLIMESLARAEGDIEALVAVATRDLSSAYRFLEIAEIYRNAKYYVKALEWAEKGLAAFPENTDSRLREFLADEYHRHTRHNEAMQLIWANFTEHPGIENYKSLKKHADITKQWPDWRQNALKHIRSLIANSKKSGPPPDRYWIRRWDNSILVEIFLWEKDVDSAWTEAQAGGCDDRLWMQLAKLREKDHPQDAISAYLKQVDPIVAGTNNSAYREAVVLIKKIGTLMCGTGQKKMFEQYKDSLMTKYKPKRNFIKLLSRIK